MRDSSWLFPDGADRDRMLELDRHLRPVRALAFAVLAAALVVSGPWLGWWTLLSLVAAVAAFRVADVYVGRLRRPEYALFAAWAASELIIAAAVALSGPSVPTTAWLAIPVLTLGARFSNRGIALGVAFALALLFAVEFGLNVAAIVADPPLVVAPAALIVCVAVFQTVLMRSEIRLRSEVVIDPLTGMLNRKALVRRVEELEQQSQLTRQPVGLIVCDVDRFKEFNDSHGHAAGDALLVDVAYRIRKALRAFDLCYRTGGEEFLVLLPGAELEETAALAEQLRRDVAGLVSDGHAVTMSFGVAGSQRGGLFRYQPLFAVADAALYDAKRSGRNCVRRAAPAAGATGVANPQTPRLAFDRPA